MLSPTELGDLLERTALAEGFALAGAIDLAKAAPAYAEHVARYDRWLAQGNAGAMQYLERGRDRRADPRQVMPGTQSLLCVAIPYRRKPGGSQDPANGPRYARYIHGRDYHEEVAARLERAMQQVAKAEPDLRWKVCVDTSAVLERSWAALAGLGWIGKNTLLIHPRLGSYFFIGVALINRETGRGPRPLPDYCGHCTRCLDGCPTRAITEPRNVDSRQCISYWTLEKRGALEISEEQKRLIGPWIAGCDICQEVCPFNLKPSREPDGPDVPGSADLLADWDGLLAETPEQYKLRIRDSALSRIKPEQFRRNLEIALGNSKLQMRLDR